MSTDCCDYECTRAPNCPAGSKDSMPYEFWPGSVVAEKLLAGEKLPELMSYDDHDWKSERKAMSARQQQAWERAQQQWFKSVPPLYNDPLPEAKPDRTTVRMLVWCGIVLALCVAGFSTLLYFWR